MKDQRNQKNQRKSTKNALPISPRPAKALCFIPYWRTTNRLLVVCCTTSSIQPSKDHLRWPVVVAEDVDCLISLILIVHGFPMLIKTDFLTGFFPLFGARNHQSWRNFRKKLSFWDTLILSPKTRMDFTCVVTKVDLGIILYSDIWSLTYSRQSSRFFRACKKIAWWSPCPRRSHFFVFTKSSVSVGLIS